MVDKGALPISARIHTKENLFEQNFAADDLLFFFTFLIDLLDDFTTFRLVIHAVTFALSNKEKNPSFWHYFFPGIFGYPLLNVLYKIVEQLYPRTLVIVRLNSCNIAVQTIVLPSIHALSWSISKLAQGVNACLTCSSLTDHVTRILKMTSEECLGYVFGNHEIGEVTYNNMNKGH